MDTSSAKCPEGSILTTDASGKYSRAAWGFYEVVRDNLVGEAFVGPLLSAVMISFNITDFVKQSLLYYPSYNRPEISARLSLALNRNNR